jgi:hypothetical protein
MTFLFNALTGVFDIVDTSTAGEFTPGSVIFAGPTGALSQDNANFYWNDSTDALGIGTTPAATAVLDVVNNSGSTKAVQVTGYGSNVGFRGREAGGTAASPTATPSGTTLTFFSGRGYGATGFAASSTGIINIVADSTFTDTSMPTHIGFNVTPVGAITSVEAMRIAPTGNVLIDTTTDNGTESLQIGSGIAANYVKYTGSTSGYVEILAPSSPTSYNLALPTAQGAASSYLRNDGSGNLSWVTSGSPPTVTSNIDGGSSATLYTTPQLVSGGTP